MLACAFTGTSLLHISLVTALNSVRLLHRRHKWRFFFLVFKNRPVKLLSAAFSIKSLHLTRTLACCLVRVFVQRLKFMADAPDKVGKKTPTEHIAPLFITVWGEKAEACFALTRKGFTGTDCVVLLFLPTELGRLNGHSPLFKSENHHDSRGQRGNHSRARNRCHFRRKCLFKKRVATLASPRTTRVTISWASLLRTPCGRRNNTFSALPLQPAVSVDHFMHPSSSRGASHPI